MAKRSQMGDAREGDENPPLRAARVLIFNATCTQDFIIKHLT